MKKFFLTLVLLLATIASTSAQKVESGSLQALKDAGKVNLTFEFVTIHSMDENSFGEYETDWFKDKPEVIGLFTDKANDTLKGLLTLGNFKNTDYTIHVIVNSISTKGNYNCDAVLLKQGKEIAKITGITGRGGKIGTKLNLIKDGAQSTGKQLGKTLKKEIKSQS